MHEAQAFTFRPWGLERNGSIKRKALHANSAWSGGWCSDTLQPTMSQMDASHRPRPPELLRALNWAECGHPVLLLTTCPFPCFCDPMFFYLFSFCLFTLLHLPTLVPFVRMSVHLSVHLSTDPFLAFCSSLTFLRHNDPSVVLQLPSPPEYPDTHLWGLGGFPTEYSPNRGDILSLTPVELPTT